MTDRPSTTITATIHNPSKPFIHDHRTGDEPWFLSVHIGGGSSMFFDTKEQLTEWCSALGAEVGALLDDGDVRPPVTPVAAAMVDAMSPDAQTVEQVSYEATLNELGQPAADAADVIAAAGI